LNRCRKSLGVAHLMRSIGLSLGEEDGHEQCHEAKEYKQVPIASVTLLLLEVPQVQLLHDLREKMACCHAKVKLD